MGTFKMCPFAQLQEIRNLVVMFANILFFVAFQHIDFSTPLPLLSLCPSFRLFPPFPSNSHIHIRIFLNDLASIITIASLRG